MPISQRMCEDRMIEMFSFYLNTLIKIISHKAESVGMSTPDTRTHTHGEREKERAVTFSLLRLLDRFTGPFGSLALSVYSLCFLLSI